MNELLAADAASPAGRIVAIMCPDSVVDAAYFAAALARHVARADEPSVVLVDGQYAAGGLDTIADLDSAPGARWGALAHAGGSIDTEKLLAALPTRDGVRVLSYERDGASVIPPDVQSATLAGFREAAEWTVVALNPAHADGTHLLELCDEVVMLVRGTVCGVAAAMSALDFVGEQPVHLVLVEAPQAQREAIAHACQASVAAAAPTRWRIAQVGAHDVLCGKWPGEGDRTMTRLLTAVERSVLATARSLTWA